MVSKWFHLESIMYICAPNLNFLRNSLLLHFINYTFQKSIYKFNVMKVAVRKFQAILHVLWYYKSTLVSRTKLCFLTLLIIINTIFHFMLVVCCLQTMQPKFDSLEQCKYRGFVISLNITDIKLDLLIFTDTSEGKLVSFLKTTVLKQL